MLNYLKMSKFIVSFDIDGTLGRQRSSIRKDDDMDFDHIVNIKDSWGSFIFYKGTINLLKKIVKNLRENEGFLILCTGGVKTYGCEDRNDAIVEYLVNILNYDAKLYDVRYQTFNKSDIEDAMRGKIDNTEWQEWFHNLFRNHSVDELHVIDVEDEFDTYFVRDHSLILSKHRDIYGSMYVNQIIHIDDTPKSVKCLTGKQHVNLIEWSRTHKDRQKQCDEVYEKIINLFRIDK